MLRLEFKESETSSRVCENNHGIPFISTDKDLVKSFMTDVELLTDRAENLSEKSEFTYETSISPLQITLPGAFLVHPLNEDEKRKINEHESQEIAAVSVTMQERLQPVPIDESFEAMVDLKKVFHENRIPVQFSDIPFHPACGDWAGKDRVFWVREHFANRIVMMSRLLIGRDLGIRFEDAFRPLGVQEGLFQRRINWTHDDHPDWPTEKIIEEARSKTAVTPRLASHKGGAAVDLRLYRTGNNELLDIGHNYPDGGALVYLESPFVTQEQWMNRNILRVASYLSDIAMYVGEDWHISHGDNLASLGQDLIPRTGYIAKYGPIKQFDTKTGKIIDVYDISELDDVFDFKLMHN